LVLYVISTMSTALSKKIAASRLKSGQCVHCGIQTHDIIKQGFSKKKVPLNIPNKVEHGCCLRPTCLNAGCDVQVTADSRPSVVATVAHGALKVTSGAATITSAAASAMGFPVVGAVLEGVASVSQSFNQSQNQQQVSSGTSDYLAQIHASDCNLNEIMAENQRRYESLMQQYQSQLTSSQSQNQLQVSSGTSDYLAQIHASDCNLNEIMAEHQRHYESLMQQYQLPVSKTLQPQQTTFSNEAIYCPILCPLNHKTYSHGRVDNTCDICNIDQDLKQFFHCDVCNWDICHTCVSYHFNKEAKVSGKSFSEPNCVGPWENGQIRCPANHVTHVHGRAHNCDICSFATPGSEFSRCDLCDWDICEKCKNQATQQDPIPCPIGHVSYRHVISINGWCCSYCTKTKSVGDVVWYCKHCDFAVCEEGVCFSRGNAGNLMCPIGHTASLYRTQTGSSYICDLCKESVEPGREVYHCWACNWGACMQCCTFKDTSRYMKFCTATESPSTVVDHIRHPDGTCEC
jgi:hypothetical protein